MAAKKQPSHLITCGCCGSEIVVAANGDYAMVEKPKHHDSPAATPVMGTTETRNDGTVVKVFHPTSGNNSGIRSETTMSSPKRTGRPVKSGSRGGSMQPMGQLNNVVRKPKRGSVNNELLAVEGAAYSDDIVPGLSGADKHYDDLLMAANEADLESHGFHNNY